MDTDFLVRMQEADAKRFPNRPETAEDVVAHLAQIGLRGEIRRTGHPEYKRVFMYDSQNVTQGRVCIHRGKYSHPKFYVEKIDSGSIVADEFFPMAWDYLCQGRGVLTREQWKAAVSEAMVRARKAHAEKLAWDKANPRPNGKPRKRRKFPNPRKWVREILFPEREAVEQ